MSSPWRGSGGPATIAGEVRDATPEERVLIDLGPLAKMLDHVAGYGPGQWKGLKPAKLDTERFEQILATRMQRFVTLLEPLLVIGLGGMVGGIVIAILTAVLSVNELAF